MGTGGSAAATGRGVLLALGTVALVAATFGIAQDPPAAAASRATAASSGGVEAATGTSPYYEVKTGTVRGLGTVLVNGQGLTLYMFVPDHQRWKSTCYKKCAEGWPPLRLPTGVTTPVAGGGAEASLLGTTTRKDGGVQVTYNRWPLYLWEVDTAPGEATGQALNSLGGLWYVLSPKGKVIKAKQKS
jgi:predicted lipoprotein with Yx(FWY)xxD motif